MTAKFNDGGPAFPQPITSDLNMGLLFPQHYGVAGMTLRDYFAAQELTRVSYEQCSVHDVAASYERVAKHCYRMADAMIKAREQ